MKTMIGGNGTVAVTVGRTTTAEAAPRSVLTWIV